MPRPARRTPYPSHIQRGIKIGKSMRSAEFAQSKRRIEFVLRHPSGPNDNDNLNHLTFLPIGSSVLVWRTSSKDWTDPHKLINMDGETIVVQLPKGRKIFQSTSVKPWTSAALNVTELDDSAPNKLHQNPYMIPTSRQYNQPLRSTRRSAMALFGQDT